MKFVFEREFRKVPKSSIYVSFLIFMCEEITYRNTG
jgi:hypothetical protein